MVALDPILIGFVSIVFVTLAVAFIFRLFKQPTIIAYIITGVLIGPFFFGLIKNQELISNLGNFGIVLLLFFIGMEIKFESLLKNWKVALIGTFLQILASIGIMFVVGYFFNWNFSMIILFGFIISLSSTAVIIKILEMKGTLNKQVGRDILGILLMQDLAIVPMIIGISLLESSINLKEILIQFVGFILIILFLFFIFKKKEIRLPFHNIIKKDHDLQIIVSLLICFGLAFFTGLFNLSTALGAFIAGIFLSKINETNWAHESLLSIKTIFLAIFFISIGMLVQVDFFIENLGPIVLLVFLVLLTNTFANALIFRRFGRTWSYSIYAGSLLSQIGEFSFLFAALGLQQGVIDVLGYQMTISVISLSLLASPIWIEMFSWVGKKSYAFERKKNI